MKSTQSLKILKAEFLEKYKLSIYFSDKTQQVVNFGPFLKGSVHPEIRKYLDLKKFKKFSIVDGELMWGDFDLIFPIMDLYENHIEHHDKATV